MTGVIHRDSEGDDTILAEGCDGADGAEETFLANLDEHTSTCHHTVGVGVGNLAIDLEVGEVANHSHFGARPDNAADFGTDVGEGCLAWRTDIGAIEGTAGLRESLLENAVLELLHPQVSLTHTHFVLILLFELVKLQLCRAQGRFGLAHTVFGA